MWRDHTAFRLTDPTKKNHISRLESRHNSWKKSDILKYFVCQLFSRLVYLYLFSSIRDCLHFFHGNRIFSFQSFHIAHCEREWIIYGTYSKECASESNPNRFVWIWFHGRRSMHRHFTIFIVSSEIVHFLEKEKRWENRQRRIRVCGEDPTVRKSKNLNIGKKYVGRRRETNAHTEKNVNLWKKRMLTKLSITILPSTCARTRWFEWIGRSWLSVYKCTHQSKHDRADATMWNRRFSFHLRSVALPFLKTALHTRPLHRMWNFKHKEWRRRRRNETIRRLRNPEGEWKKERKTNKKRTNVHICSSPNKTDFGLVKTTIYL